MSLLEWNLFESSCCDINITPNIIIAVRSVRFQLYTEHLRYCERLLTDVSRLASHQIARFI
jgi:hypothetical protein